MSARLTWATIVIVGACLAASVGTARGEPVRTGDELEEHAKVRVQTARIRIEPGHFAQPGECLGMEIEDLKVKLRGDRIVDPDALRLEREPQRAVHALLIDTSGSMFGRLDHARDAATQYVKRLRPGLDRAMVATFDDSVVLVESLTDDRDRLIDSIGSVRMGGMTSMIDALYYSMLELRTHRGRAVILVLTDGVDTASRYERHYVNDLVERTPELTVFTIGVSLPYIGVGAPSGVNSTKRFLQRLAERTNGTFFDVPTSASLEIVFLRIHEMLENEATVSVVDPHPDADPGTLKISSRRENCRIRVFKSWDVPEDDPSRVPLGNGVEVLPSRLPLPPFAYYSSLRAFVDRHLIDPDCAPIVGRGGDTDPAWYVEIDEHDLRGCTVDVTLSRGLLYDPFSGSWVQVNDWMGIKTRPFEASLPMIGGLPTSPVEIMDPLAEMAMEAASRPVQTDPRMVPMEAHARPYHDLPSLTDGAQLLEMRAYLARALYTRADYREWALARLRRQAEDEITELEELYARRFPGTPPEILKQVVAETDEAKAIRLRARAPAQIDIQALLGAWLGDISAHDLFVAWEIELINRALASGEPSEFDAASSRWTATRAILFAPSYSRVLGLVSPGFDPAEDRVGYWRVILPRPAWLLTRVQGFESEVDVGDLPLDLIPEQPYGLWLLGELEREYPETVREWRTHGYTARSLTYELAGPTARHSLERAYDDHSITLLLQSETDDATTLRAHIVIEGRKRKLRLERLDWNPAPDHQSGPAAALPDETSAGHSNTTWSGSLSTRSRIATSRRR